MKINLKHHSFFDAPWKVTLISVIASVVLSAGIAFTIDPDSVTISMMIACACSFPISLGITKVVFRYRKILERKNHELEEADKKITDSLRYAALIQKSLLPNLDKVKKHLPESFFIWMPKDIVGGDVFHVDFFETGFIVAVIDCTGHGVPGALMSMIASSGMRKIISDEGCHDPAEILKKLNCFVKTSLRQDTGYAESDDGMDMAQRKDGRRQHGRYAESDDGMDMALCHLNTQDRTLTFAGAKLPLIYVHNDELTVIKGDRQSIGYRKSDLNFRFHNHTIRIEEGMSFYMHTDGFVDQLGGERIRRFGNRRFRNLLKEICREPFENQCGLLMQAFEAHKGKNERQDDVTVLGFQLSQHFTLCTGQKLWMGEKPAKEELDMMPEHVV